MMCVRWRKAMRAMILPNSHIHITYFSNMLPPAGCTFTTLNVNGTIAGGTINCEEIIISDGLVPSMNVLTIFG